MTKYKITKMNVGFGEVVYTINREDTFKDHFSQRMITDLIPVIPIRYYKSIKTAQTALRKLSNR